MRDLKKENLINQGYMNSAMLGEKFGRKQLRPSELPKELLSKALIGSVKYRGGIYFNKDGLKILEEYLKLSPFDKTAFVSKLRYNCDWFTESDIVKEKQKETNLKKYGVISTSQIQSIKEKQVKTLEKNYGVNVPFKNTEIKEKYLRKHILENTQLKGNIQDRCDKFHDDITVCSEYIGEKKEVYLYCNVCGNIFKRFPINLNYSCPYCTGSWMNKDWFVIKSNLLHYNKYDYSKTIYINNKTPVKIFCKKCNKYFFQRPNDHLNGHGHDCVKSLQEERLADWLSSKNINFIRNYTFDDCKGKIKKLPFDFYLTDYDLLIEIQGEQHLKKKWESQDFEERKRLDKIKKDYAEKNHNFLEIFYSQNEIEVLKNYLK